MAVVAAHLGDGLLEAYKLLGISVDIGLHAGAQARSPAVPCEGAGHPVLSAARATSLAVLGVLKICQGRPEPCRVRQEEQEAVRLMDGVCLSPAQSLTRSHEYTHEQPLHLHRAATVETTSSPPNSAPKTGLNREAAG